MLQNPSIFSSKKKGFKKEKDYYMKKGIQIKYN
jgi:hypothetical protein